ncbi:Nramp family divalent metal transporter [Patescibacteria group bacterium]|nr:Nramp family divalent metal transporter [Patescibacteria group bacterium]
MQSVKEFPKPIPLLKLIGPSFIILALGLGSGEVILWPYMASNYGLGIAWGAVLGISFQYFINMEIERYALIKGESVFIGLNRIFKWSAYWFIVSTFIGFGLPGIIAASAHVFGSILGIDQFKWIAIIFLITIGIILSAGKTVYGMMEKITRSVILIGVPFVFLLAIYLSTKTDWLDLANGIAGRGADYLFFPEGLALATFLAAFAYSGAGGNLNLTQSIYIKEKGYGMGKYSQKISGLFVVKKDEKIKLSGENFKLTKENISRYKIWWKRVSLEHLFVFWFIGGLSMCLLMILAYTTTHGVAGNAEGINFVINEGRMIAQNTFPLLGTLFLIVVAIMLFQTQLGVMDSTSRIMAENFAEKKLGKNENAKINLSKIYYIFLWAQIAFGITLFLLNIHEPKTLLILGAVINAFAMFIHIALVSILNYKTLPKIFHPSWPRKIVLLIIFIFFGYFSILVLGGKLGII